MIEFDALHIDLSSEVKTHIGMDNAYIKRSCRRKIVYNLIELGYESLITVLLEEFSKDGFDTESLEITYDKAFLKSLLDIWEAELCNSVDLGKLLRVLPKQDIITRDDIEKFDLDLQPYDLSDASLRSSLLGEIILSDTTEELIVSFNLHETLELQKTESTCWARAWRINNTYTANMLAKNFTFLHGGVCGEVYL